VKRNARVGLVVVAAFLGLCGISLWYTFREDHGIGVDSVGWLPPEAHNITYISNDAITLAEFDVEEQAFEEWCTSRKMPLRKLSSQERYAVMRAAAILVQRGIVPRTTSPNGVEEDRHGQTFKRFRAGDLFYEERWPNGGGYTIGYDIKERRGYYKYTHH
jgi:hypothetical protein